MALFRKDLDQEGLANELRLREESLKQLAQELAERERTLQKRESEFEVQKLNFKTKAKELKRRGEILVRLKKLIDQRIAESQLSSETVSATVREAGGDSKVYARPAEQARASESSSAPVPQPSVAEPVRQASDQRKPSASPEPNKPVSKPAAAEREPAQQDPKPAKANEFQTVAEKLAALKSKVSTFTKADVLEPDSHAKGRRSDSVLHRKAPPDASAKGEQAVRSGANQTTAEKLAALKRNVAQVTKEEGAQEPAPAARTETAPSPQPDADAKWNLPDPDGSFFDLDRESVRDEDKQADALYEEQAVHNNEFDLSGTDQAWIFDTPGDTTVMVPEDFHAMIDAELARSDMDVETPLEKHLRAVEEGVLDDDDVGAEEILDTEMSVLWADRLRFLEMARRAEDALTASQIM